jgi:hypothetical protein
MAANGNTDTATTALTFTFSETVSGLTADNITIGGTGVTKGALTGGGTTWTLALTAATAGNITVSITKDGIETGQKQVTVYVQGPSGIIYTVAANGDTDTTTTALTFTFSAAVSGLTADNITISGTGVTKGALTGGGTTWTLALTVTTAQNITMSIAKDGIEAGQKQVIVYVQGQPAPSITYTVATNGNTDTATTALTFTFSGTISGLTADNITISGTGVTKGALTGGGTIWTLALTVATTGNITVSIAKDGIEIGQKQVTVYKEGSQPLSEVTGLTAAAGIGAVTLTWTDPEDADLDHIEITWTGGNATAEKSAANNRANTKTITGLISGTPYTFTVKTVDASGNKSQGEIASASPIDIGAGTAITIASTENWTNALTQISTGGNGTSSNPKVYFLDIQGAVSVPGAESSENSISGSYKTVHLMGSGILSLASAGSIFRISDSNQILIIDGPTLIGISGSTPGTSNNAPVVYAEDGTVELRSGTISGNTCWPFYYPTPGTSTPTSVDSSYGGVYIGSGTFTMSGGTISGNTAYSSYSATSHSYGGGVYVENGTFTMLGGTISGNTAASESSSIPYGGGVYVENGTFTMSGGAISGNTAAPSEFSSSSYGGGVYLGNGTFTMSGGAIDDNTASSSYAYGGGVYVRNGTLAMSGGTISGNTAYSPIPTTDSSSFAHGGGVYVSIGTLIMSGGTIGGNTAHDGGGVYVWSTTNSGGTFTKTGGTVYGDSPADTTTPQTSGPNANTATHTFYLGRSGHAVLYYCFYGTYPSGFFDYCYRNETLADDASGNISTTDTLPSESGTTLGNWTMRGY